MRVGNIVSCVVLLAAGSSALAPERQVLITYPKDTPQAAIDDARSRLKDIGGEILHEFKLIKGFVVKSTAQALETFNSLSLEYEPTIEDDGTVTIQDQDVS